MAAKGPHDGMRRVREREHSVPRVTPNDTYKARDRTTRARVANWAASIRRHVITAHDNIYYQHPTPKCIPPDHNVYISYRALANGKHAEPRTAIRGANNKTKPTNSRGKM